MGIFKVPVTVLTTGDELLYGDYLYVTDEVPEQSEFSEGFNLAEYCITGTSYSYQSALSVAVMANETISGVSISGNSDEILNDAGFKHVFKVTAGSYHWIINGQKFLVQINNSGKNNTVPVAYPMAYMTYLSGSYADKHPNYVNKSIAVFGQSYSNQLATFLSPTKTGLMFPSAPSVQYGVDTNQQTVPYYKYNGTRVNFSSDELIFRELIYNIPQSEREDIDIGKTYPEYDPTAAGDTSEPLNPEQNPNIGDFDANSEPIPPPDIDELNKQSAVNTGLIGIYNPNRGQVAQLANFLWSDLFSLDTFKKMFGSPMEAILSLHIIPVTPSTQEAQDVVIGNVNTGVQMPKVTQQFVSFNCGAVQIQSFFGSALDFSPFTKLSIFLPYIGVRELDIDEVMYHMVGVQYMFDVLTGACTALITVDGDVRYQFSGSACLQMPINATNWTNVISNIMSLATATIATVASSGAAAGQLISAGANAVTSSKMGIERSGAVSGAAGFLGVQRPYLIRTIPRQSLAKNYQHFSGYPSNITAQIGSLSGYTEVESVYLDGVSATDQEKDEITMLLRGGVIV